MIVLIGENRTFDHTFGTYLPRGDQTIANLVSMGIVNRDGTSLHKLSTGYAGHNEVPAWSPDGSKIVFVGRDASDEIEAYHSEATLKLISRFVVGRVELQDELDVLRRHR